MKNSIRAALAASAAVVCAFSQQGVDYVTQIRNKPVTDARQYAYSFESSSGQVSGNLTVPGTNTLTFLTGPLGVTATAANRYVYISNGTGTPEAAHITGGTCTPLASNCTLIVTTVNPHTGFWTVSSPTFGVQEAIDAENSSVYVVDGNYSLYAPITLTTPGGQPVYLEFGYGLITVYAPINIGTASVLTGPPAGLYQPSVGPGFEILQGAGANLPAIINVTGYSGVIENLMIYGYYQQNPSAGVGILLTNGTQSILRGVVVHYCNSHGIASPVGAVPSGVAYWTNIVSAFNQGDGFYLENFSDIFCLNCQSLANGGYGMELNSANALRFSNGDISENLLDGLYYYWRPGKTSGCVLTIATTHFVGNAHSDINLDGNTGAGGSACTGSVISGNNFASQGRTTNTYPAILLNSTSSNTITGNTFQAGGPSSYAYAVKITDVGSGPFYAQSNAIVGNSVQAASVGTDFLSITSGIPVVLANNGGVDDSQPTLASAATVTLTSQSTYIVTGTTTITTINNGWNGRRVTLQSTPGITIGGGGNVPLAHVIPANGSVTLTSYGGNWY
jgi:hypothetical protein